MKKILNLAYFLMFLIILIILLIFGDGQHLAHKPHLINNWCSLLIAIIIFLGIYKILSHFIKKIADKNSNKIMIIFTIILIPLLFFSASQYMFVTGWDAGEIRKNANFIALGNLDSIKNWYFSAFQNNIIITCFLSVIIRISYFLNISNFDYTIVFFNCILFAWTGYFVFYIVNKIFNNLNKSIFAYLLYFLLIGLSPWIVVFYSDIMALFIVALAVFLYIKAKEETKFKYAYLLIDLFLVFWGFAIKPQIAIIFIAMIIYDFATFDFKKLKSMNTYLFTIVVVLIAIVSCLTINLIKYNTFFNINKEAKVGITHYFMLGLNNKTKGIYSLDDIVFSHTFPTNKMRNKANMEVALYRIKDLKLSGMADLYKNKILINYNDGSFAFSGEGSFYKYVYEKNNKISDFYKSYYHADGKNVNVFYTVQQIIWIGVLFFNLLSVKKDENYLISILKLSIIGLTIFETIFEPRARYLFAYAPIYIIIAISGMDNLSNKLKFRSKIRTK